VPGSLVGDVIADARGTMNTPSSADLQAGLKVSQISIAWTVTVCVAAVVTGVTNDSLVLIAFGLTGLLDGAGSFVLVLHFGHALAHNAISSARERLALRVVSIGLIVIGGSTAIESARRLIVSEAGHGSSIGIGIAGASAVVLAALAVAKHRIAHRLASNALRADGWLSATGAALALIAVTGMALSSGTAPTWIDPAAALSVACVAVVVGVIELRREESAL
jgi:divalent metal cation (Fe/Co/Zn/Cd) transporter